MHLPQNGTIGFDPHPLCSFLTGYLGSARFPCFPLSAKVGTLAGSGTGRPGKVSQEEHPEGYGIDATRRALQHTVSLVHFAWMLGL